MTFAEPSALAALFLVPAAALAYLALQRRRRREAAAWSPRHRLDAVVTGIPGWRRHMAPLLIALALVALVLAAARPQRTVAAPQRTATVMMVTDVSGSMEAEDVAPDRLTAAVRAARLLARRLPSRFRLGLVTFNDSAAQQAPPSTDRRPVLSALDALVADGGTAMGDGLAQALFAARAQVRGPDGAPRRLPAVIVLLSDGANTSGVEQPLDVAARARAARIPIHAVALGTPDGVVIRQDPLGFTHTVPVPPDTDTLRRIARMTGGRFFTAADSERLESIYANLGTRISSRPVQREISAAFAGAGLVLLLAAGALGLRWFARPV